MGRSESHNLWKFMFLGRRASRGHKKQDNYALRTCPDASHNRDHSSWENHGPINHQSASRSLHESLALFLHSSYERHRDKTQVYPSQSFQRVTNI